MIPTLPPYDAWLPGIAAAVLFGFVGGLVARNDRAIGAAGWIGWALRMAGLVVLGVTLGGLPEAMGLGDAPWSGIPVGDLVRAAVLVVLGTWGIRATARFLRTRFERQGRMWSSMVADKGVSYGGAVVLIMLVADTVSLDLTALLATAGVVGIAVGWAAQTSLSNVIAGVFLLLDRPFTVGDAIMLEGQMGVVDRISLMSTFVRTFDNLVVRWPNEVVLKATVTNYSALPVRRIDSTIRIAADAPIERAMEALRTVAADEPLVLLEPAPEVRVTGLVDNGVSLQFRVWVARTDFLNARDRVLIDAQRALLAAGVPPRVPAWEIHVDADEPDPAS